MRTKSILFLVFSALVPFSFLGAAGSDDANSGTNGDDALQIGVIYLDAQGYYAGVRAGVQNRSAELGREVNIIETNARGDAAKESSFISTLAAAGIDALVLSAVSADGSVRAVRQAAEEGIPVICYNTCVNDEAVESYVYSYAVGDPYAFGRLIGTAAADYIRENDIQSPKIGMVNCEQFEVCITRREGFIAALDEAGIEGWELVANQEGTELDKAISTAQQILSAHPDIDILFGQSGGATLGAVRGVRNTGRVGEVAVFGSDMTTEIARELESRDVLKGVVDISGKAMGSLALDLALAAIEGVQAPDERVIQAPIDLYLSSSDAAAWITTHPDGLP